MRRPPPEPVPVHKTDCAMLVSQRKLLEEGVPFVDAQKRALPCNCHSGSRELVNA